MHQCAGYCIGGVYLLDSPRPFLKASIACHIEETRPVRERAA